MKQLLLLSFFILSALLVYPQINTSYQFNGEQTAFTENLGQVVDQDGKPVPNVLAKASMPGLDMYLTKTGVTYILLQYTEDLTAKHHPVYMNDKKYKITYSRVDVALQGAVINNQQMQLTGDAGWQSNYYKTQDGKGQLAVPHFTNMTVQNVYPGIDWVWKFNTAGKLEYEFVVHPGADPSVIKMQYSYADLTQKQNNLVISTRIGSITEGPLQASSSNSKVQVTYALDAKSKTISFSPTGYDKTKDLLIDPPLALNWSAEFGGSFLNGLRGVATDTLGGIYLCGYTTSLDFVTKRGGSGAYFDSTYNGQSDVILLKLDTNQNLKWATYMGGPNNDFANSVCYSQLNNQIYITGGAETGFPITGTGSSSTVTGQDAFVAIFTNALALKYSSFYGGNGTDEGLKICTDNNYLVYVSGYTNSTNNSFASFAYTGGYNQTTVTGVEAFVMAFAANNYNPNILWWGTKYGGNGDDYATAITTDSLHNLVVAGYTTSTNIPLQQADSAYYQSANAGGTDGFILKFGSINHNLLNATYYGGSGNDYFTDVATGYKGNFDFTGRTNSPNFPLRNIGGYGYYQPHLADTSGDAFIVKCANNLTMKWSTYYGGKALDAGTGISTDAAGQMYVSGFTFSTNFPVDSFARAFYQGVNHGNSDGFIALFTDLGVLSWSTYKGDSCYQYPYEIAYDRKFNKFYVAGEGLLACGQSLPDSGEVISGTSSIGFCWGFSGLTTPPCIGFDIGVTYNVQPCPGQCNGVATVNVEGGHVPYHYIWSNGVDSTTSHNLCVSEEWVEAKDTMGCFAGVELNFNPLAVSATGGSIVCLPGPAAITAATTGGNTGADLYQWSIVPGLYNDSSTILVSNVGTYTVTAEDSKACTATATALVNFINYPPVDQPEILFYPGCGNINDGKIVINYTGSDNLFPNGNITWEDQNGNLIASGDTFTGANTLTTYYVVDSAYCANGVTQPYYMQIYLGNSTDNVAFSGFNNPTTCTSFDGSAALQFNSQNFYTNSTGLGSPFYSWGTMAVDYYPDIFQWSDGETTQIAYNLGIGPYSVTITDNTCVTVLSGTLALPTPQVAPVIDSVYCNGGYIIPNPYGGNGASYSYQWSDGSSGNIDFGPSGYYTVTITDQLNCADTSTFYLPQGTPLSMVASSNPANCYGQNGVIIVEASGGTPPYQGTGVFSEPAGYYTITVTDNNGCTASSPAEVQQPDSIIVTATLVTPAGCAGGSAIYNISATGSYWLPYTGTGNQFEAVGTDVVTVYDNYGCTGIDTIVVIPSGIPIIPHNTYTPILCYGGNTILTITATGGNGPITGTGVFTKAAGTYYFTLSDSAGCSVVDTVVVTQPAQLTVVLNSAGVTCYSGSASTLVSGGSPLYMFQWSNSLGNYASDSFIAITDTGTYSVTVEDENLCSAAGSVNVGYHNVAANGNLEVIRYPTCGNNDGVAALTNQIGNVSWWSSNFVGNIANFISVGDTLLNMGSGPGPGYVAIDSGSCFDGTPAAYYLEVPFDVEDVVLTDAAATNCFPANGSASIVLYSPLQFLFYGGNEIMGNIIYNGNLPSVTQTWSNGDTGRAIYGLSAGTFTVTLTDGACVNFQSVTVPGPPPPVIYPVVDSTLCYGGSIDVSSISGNAPYSFLWSNGSSANTLTGLSSGSYNVTVTDRNHCFVIDSFNLIARQTVVEHVSVTPPPCIGGSATIIVTASGGTSPYTGTGTLFKPAGTYILIVTDSNGCSASDTVTVPSSSALSSIAITANATPILCNGEYSTLTVNATGGVAPYTGTGTFSKPAGDYVITVSDNAGCSATDSLDITQPSALRVTKQVSTIPCFGDSATITLGAQGGTAPYTGLGTFKEPAGNYVFVVTDTNGCSLADSISLTQPTRLTLTDTATQVNCFGGHATVILTATGGTGPYTGTGTLPEPAGNDLLVVSDQNGCKDSVNLDITQPSPINITVQLPDSSLHCADSIKAIITATGGSGNYTGTGSVNYIQSGTYTIRVTDGSGCTVDTSVHITLDTCTGIDNVFANTGVMVYPNPASDKFYVKFLTALDESTDLRLYAVDGKLVMLKTLGAGTDIAEMNCNQLASGVYILRTVVMNKEYNFKVVVER